METIGYEENVLGNRKGCPYAIPIKCVNLLCFI